MRLRRGREGRPCMASPRRWWLGNPVGAVYGCLVGPAEGRAGALFDLHGVGRAVIRRHVGFDRVPSRLGYHFMHSLDDRYDHDVDELMA